MIPRQRRETTQTCSQSVAQALLIIRFGGEGDDEEEQDEGEEEEEEEEDGDFDVGGLSH